jgi:hypothetical protein
MSISEIFTTIAADATEAERAVHARLSAVFGEADARVEAIRKEIADGLAAARSTLAEDVENLHVDTLAAIKAAIAKLRSL